MKFITFMQSFAAAGVLTAGALFALDASAAMHSCTGMAMFGASIASGCDGTTGYSNAGFGSGNRGASDAYVYAQLSHNHDVPMKAEIVALDSSLNAISGCKASDTNATDGVSVSDQTGCQNGAWVSTFVSWDVP
jgi:hypothetical protein